MPRGFHSFAIVMLLLLLAQAPGAWAQASQMPLDARHLAVSGEVGFFTDQPADASTLYVFVPQVSAQYALDSHLSMSADFGAIVIDSVPDAGPAQTSLRMGNPSVLAMWRGDTERRRFRFGIGWTAPVARIRNDGDARLQRAAFNYAQGMSGLMDVWLWAPYRTAALGYAHIEQDLGKLFVLEGELAPALLVPVFEDAGVDHVDVFLPAAVGVSERIHKRDTIVGVRVQLVVMPTNHLDAAQVSLVPWLRIVVEQSFFELRFTTNLGEPLAGSRGPGTWGLHLLGGATL